MNATNVKALRKLKDPSKRTRPLVNATRVKMREIRKEIAKIDSSEVRDTVFATAFIANPYDKVKALLEAYPEYADKTRQELSMIACEKVNTNAAVREFLAGAIADCEKQRPHIMAHLIMIAKDMTEPQNALGAIDRLAKIAGWYAPVKIEGTQKNFNIHSMLSDPAAVREALALMEHEPGAAVAIQSDARDDYERRHGRQTDVAEDV